MGKSKSGTSDANSGNEDLHVAARSGNLKAVEAICSTNPLSVNSRDRHSRTPLHLAAWSGHVEVVNYLCKNKGDVGAAAMDDMGAIHFAAQKGHLEVVKILVTFGVSIKSSNRKGMTALHYAAQGSNPELVLYLLKKGANIKTKNKAGKTAVDLASNEEIRKHLVKPRPVLDKVVKRDDGQKSEHSEGEKIEDANKKSDGNEQTLKRKGEDNIVKENETGSKKSKVALCHLMAEDDMQEEDENL